MNGTKRLQLIIKAVRYCKDVKKKGMPTGCYTKALREPIHFLWERRIGAGPNQVSGPKECAARFRSRKAKGIPFRKGKLVYDHAIPLNYLQDKLLNLSDVAALRIKKLLKKFCIPVLITKKEDRKLDKAHYRERMPDNWNGIDFRARYDAVGIRIAKNKCRLKAKK
jgi:hypothetical protein